MKVNEVKWVVLLLTILLICNSQGKPEEVWVQTLRPNLRSRTFNEKDKVASELVVGLKRGTDTIKLKLEENIRINANAPLYELLTDLNGEQTIVKKETQPITDVRFYQDREHTGTFAVRCQQAEGPYCKHLMSGNLYIDGVNYDIYPSPDNSTRTFRDWVFGVRHVLIRQDTAGQLSQFIRVGKDLKTGLPVPQEMFRGLAFEKGDQVEDGLPLPPEQLKAGETLKNDILQLWEQKILKAKRRQENGKTRYTVECFIVMDPPLWEQHYEEVASNIANDTDAAKEAATEQRLRQYFAHILNGVDLRYMSIEDPEMEIYLTLSGFLIIKERGENNPYNSSKVVIGADGTEHAEAYEFVQSVQSWVNRRIARQNNDHVFVFTGYTLFDGSDNSTSVIGLAYVGGVCSSFRTSINQEHGYNYWLMTSLAAHELGHNLGAGHDLGQNASCNSSAGYVMAPSVSSSLNPSQYRINPWRFSNCSISDFKETFINLTNNCLLDIGDFYNETAYSIHISKLPGEIYNLTEQCQLLQGDNSILCSSGTDEGICSRLWCSNNDGFCYAFAAAPGSPCGQTNSNKWCYEGLCQVNPDLEVTTQNTATDILSTIVNDVPSSTSDITSTEIISTTAETIPSTTETFSSTETIPSTTETIPSTSEFIPSTSEAIPSSSETIPSSSETISTSHETFPTSSETSSNTESSPTTSQFAFSSTTEPPATSSEDPNCVDNGFWGYECDEMQLWYKDFDQFCHYTREYFCCATCRDRNIACKDFGFAGLSCSTLRRWSRSQASFCNNWGRYCCISCSNSLG